VDGIKAKICLEREAIGCFENRKRERERRIGKAQEQV